MSYLSLTAGHPIPGLPAIVFDVWRVALWVLMWLVIREWLEVLTRRPRPDRATALGMSSLLVFTLGSAIRQLENWNDGAAIEGLPVTTLAVVLAALAIHARRQGVR